MNKILKNIATVLLCFLIAASALTAILSSFLRQTLFSQDFYLGIVATPSYLAMVKDAVEKDFQAQSSYVGVPEDVFAAGIDDSQLHLMLRNHIASAVNYLNGLADYEMPAYPVDLLRDPLYAYLETASASAGTAPTAEQYGQLDLVAEDSAGIIAREVCLIDVSLVQDRAVFRQALSLLQNLRDSLIPALMVAALSVAILILLYGKAWRSWLNAILVAVWTVGSLLMVPTLVLHFTGLTKRLGISTPYLKYFVDSVLTRMNLHFLWLGIALFLPTTAALVALKLTHHRHREKTNSSGPRIVVPGV